MRFWPQLDEELARFLGTEAAAVFPSGYGTNASVLGHLFGLEDLILYDELAHNSIVQGTLLSKAAATAVPPQRFRVPRQAAAATSAALIVASSWPSKGVYSMDGDYPNLPRFIEVKRRHAALLYVDEAHSLGVWGATGRGICEHYGVDPADGDLWMGTISKALGSAGGYLAGRDILIQYLKYTTPAFVFATGLSPANAAAALAALRLLQVEPDRVARLRDRCAIVPEVGRRLRAEHGQQQRHSGDSDHSGRFPTMHSGCLRVAPSGHRRATDPLSGGAGKPVAAPVLYHRRAYRGTNLPYGAVAGRLPGCAAAIVKLLDRLPMISTQLFAQNIGKVVARSVSERRPDEIRVEG